MSPADIGFWVVMFVAFCAIAWSMVQGILLEYQTSRSAIWVKPSERYTEEELELEREVKREAARELDELGQTEAAALLRRELDVMDWFVGRPHEFGDAVASRIRVPDMSNDEPFLGGERR